MNQDMPTWQAALYSIGIIGFAVGVATLAAMALVL